MSGCKRVCTRTLQRGGKQVEQLPIYNLNIVLLFQKTRFSLNRRAVCGGTSIRISEGLRVYLNKSI
jgi:hypothetical protein